MPFFIRWPRNALNDLSILLSLLYAGILKFPLEIGNQFSMIISRNVFRTYFVRNAYRIVR